MNIETGAGWIDSDYRGELKVDLKNPSSKPFQINPGDCIAQLVVLPVVDVGVESALQLEETEQDSAGFSPTDNRYDK